MLLPTLFRHWTRGPFLVSFCTWLCGLSANMSIYSPHCANCNKARSGGDPRLRAHGW